MCPQTDAAPEVCKRMCRANHSEPVLSLVSYYQMVRDDMRPHHCSTPEAPIMCTRAMWIHQYNNLYDIVLMYSYTGESIETS